MKHEMIKVVWIVTRWVAVRNIQPHAQTRPAKAMKLTLCTFPLGMLFQDGFMVGIPWTIGMEMEETGDEQKNSLIFIHCIGWCFQTCLPITLFTFHYMCSFGFLYSLYRFGHLVDLYAWNPHCRYLDGTGPSGSGMCRCCP